LRGRDYTACTNKNLPAKVVASGKLRRFVDYPAGVCRDDPTSYDARLPLRYKVKSARSHKESVSNERFLMFQGCRRFAGCSQGMNLALGVSDQRRTRHFSPELMT
jgi:hypothetical protein